MTGCTNTSDSTEKSSSKQIANPSEAIDESKLSEEDKERQKEAGVVNTSEIVGQWNSIETLEGNATELILTLGSDNRFSLYEYLSTEEDDSEIAITANASASGTYTIDGDKLTLTYLSTSGADDAVTGEWIDKHLVDQTSTYTFTNTAHQLTLVNSEGTERVFNRSVTE